MIDENDHGKLTYRCMNCGEMISEMILQYRDNGIKLLKLNSKINAKRKGRSGPNR